MNIFLTTICKVTYLIFFDFLFFDSIDGKESSIVLTSQDVNAREILNQFNIHSNHLKEVEEGLQVLKQRIADGIESIFVYSWTK